MAKIENLFVSDETIETITPVNIKIKKNLKILTIIDPHAADHSPGARIDSYRDAFFDKLDQVGELAAKHKVDCVVVTGDIFSEKKEQKNSHYLTSMISFKFLSYPCPVFGILGNHDLNSNRFESWKTQPASVLIRSQALQLLDFNHVTFEMKSGKKVRLRGGSYNHEKNFEYVQESRGDEDKLIQVTHFAVCPDGGTYDRYNEKMYSYKELATTPPDVFILGHIHNYYGISEIKGTHFLQHGSLMRSTTHCYNLERGINVGLIEIDPDMNITCSEIPLNIKPSAEIFDLEKKKRIEEETKRLEDYLQRLSGDVEELKINEEIDEENLTVEALIFKLDLMDVDPDELNKKYQHYMNQVSS